MRDATRGLVVGLVVFGTFTWADEGIASRSPRAKKRFLEPAEIVKRLEASPVEFQIKSIDELDLGRGKLAEALWPERVRAVPLPKVVRAKNGAVSIEPWPEPPEARPRARRSGGRVQEEGLRGGGGGLPQGHRRGALALHRARVSRRCAALRR